MKHTQYFGETLNGQLFQMMGSDTMAMGRFVDVVRVFLAFHKAFGFDGLLHI